MFYKVSQVEQLPREDMSPRAPIVLDEFRPNLPRGHNPAHTVDELKIILKALYDVNLPKFVNEDIALFKVGSRNCG